MEADQGIGAAEDGEKREEVLVDQGLGKWNGETGGEGRGRRIKSERGKATTREKQRTDLIRSGTQKQEKGEEGRVEKNRKKE